MKLDSAGKLNLGEGGMEVIGPVNITSEFTIGSLTGTSIRLLQVDKNGKLLSLEPGTEGQLLGSDGTWKGVPYSITTDGNLYLGEGSSKIGIGTDSPTQKLHVGGNLKIEGNAEIAGSIIGGSATLSSLNVSSISGANRLLQVDSTGAIIGLQVGSSGQYLNNLLNWENLPSLQWDTNSNGDIGVVGKKVGIGTFDPVTDLELVGNMRLGGNFIMKDLTDTTNTGDSNNIVMTFKTFTASQESINLINLSNGVGTSPAPPLPTDASGSPQLTTTCTTGQIKVGSSFFQTKGLFSSYVGGGATSIPNPTLPNFRALYSGMGYYNYGSIYPVNSSNGTNTQVQGFIETSDNHPSSNNLWSNLYINSICGRDVHICNPTSGVVTIGKNFELGEGVIRDMNVITNISSSSTNDNIKAIATYNTNGSNSTQSIFEVSAFTGKTSIGKMKLANYNAHANALLQVNGDVACKGIYVLPTNGDWPDYVFSQNYPLRSIQELEQFYQREKHLPEVPAEKEILESGYGVAEMDAALLKRLEENTLYIVAQDKRIQELELLVKSLAEQIQKVKTEK